MQELEEAEEMEEKPADIYRYLTPLEARRGFPQALAALKANPKLARQPMPGSGRGSKWLPLHCVLLLGPKYPGWWCRLGVFIELELDVVAAMASSRDRTASTPSMRPHESLCAS